MKKLFLKDGDYLEVRTSKDETGRYIAVYQEEKHLYTVFSGKSATRQMILFAGETEELYFYQIKDMNEVCINFNQYFNFLEQ